MPGKPLPPDEAVKRTLTTTPRIPLSAKKKTSRASRTRAKAAKQLRFRTNPKGLCG